MELGSNIVYQVKDGWCISMLVDNTSFFLGGRVLIVRCR